MRTIRTLDVTGVGTLLDWAADEGWNPGLADARAFHAADPNGFIGAFMNEVMVAGISAVAYDDQFGFIGLYICHPDHRGQGQGRAVWDAAMERLGSRTIGLDGVPAQQANYQGMGFVKAYETVRMTGTLPHAATEGLRRVQEVSQIASLDRGPFTADRKAFLQHWIAPPNTAMVADDETGAVAYAVCRPCRQGAKIGPLIARNVSLAISLLGAFEGEVQMDVPTERQEILTELEHMGFRGGFTTARMYRGAAPPLSAALFSVASLELG